MASVTEQMPMAKAKGRPRNPGGEGAQVRIEADLASKARYLAAEEGTTVLELLSSILRPALDLRFRRAAANVEKGAEPTTE